MPIFFLFVHFHIRLRRQEEEQCSGCYPFQLVDRGFSPEKQISTCKTHWGEKMVWLHWVRLISWFYTWLSKEMPLSMSADLARYHGRGLKDFISHRMPYRATMSMGICGKYLVIKIKLNKKFGSLSTVHHCYSYTSPSLQAEPSFPQDRNWGLALCTASSLNNCADSVLYAQETSVKI